MCAGLATQSVPLYLSEIAPVKARGSLNIMFQLSITIGILIAELINLGAGRLLAPVFQVSLASSCCTSRAAKLLGLCVLPNEALAVSIFNPLPCT